MRHRTVPRIGTLRFPAIHSASPLGPERSQMRLIGCTVSRDESINGPRQLAQGTIETAGEANERDRGGRRGAPETVDRLAMFQRRGQDVSSRWCRIFCGSGVWCVRRIVPVYRRQTSRRKNISCCRVLVLTPLLTNSERHPRIPSRRCMRHYRECRCGRPAFRKQQTPVPIWLGGSHPVRHRNHGGHCTPPPK